VLIDDERAGGAVDEDLGAGGIELLDRVLMVEPAGDEPLVVPEVLADADAEVDALDIDDLVAGG
jgi:hypothetical protein